MAIGAGRYSIRVIVGAQDRAESLRRRIVKIFSLFSYTILASLSKPTLNAALARSFISYIQVISKM